MSCIEQSVADFMSSYRSDRVQMFHTPSVMPDRFEVFYKGYDGIARYCPDWNYMEILGASPELYKRIFDKFGY